MSEATILNSVIRTFGTRPDMRLWRANAGAAVYQGRRVTFGVPGQADLTGILPVTCPHCRMFTVGARLEIETKADSGRQSEAQVRYEAIIRRNHGLYVLARNVDDVAEAIEKYRAQ